MLVGVLRHGLGGYLFRHFDHPYGSYAAFASDACLVYLGYVALFVKQRKRVATGAMLVGIFEVLSLLVPVLQNMLQGRPWSSLWGTSPLSALVWMLGSVALIVLCARVYWRQSLALDGLGVVLSACVVAAAMFVIVERAIDGSAFAREDWRSMARMVGHPALLFAVRAWSSLIFSVGSMLFFGSLCGAFFARRSGAHR
jgi:hypothetical protein